MSEQDDGSRVQEKAQQLLLQATRVIATTPLTPQSPTTAAPPAEAAGHADLDQTIEDLRAVEAQLSSAVADDDALLWNTRIALGALYATRCLHHGWADSDRSEGVRLLRAARASGHLTAAADPSAVLLFAVLLVPSNAITNREPRSLDALKSIFAFGQELFSGGPAFANLSEMRELLAEVLAARPDDPRVGPLVAYADGLGRAMSLVQDFRSGAGVSMDSLGKLAADVVPSSADHTSSIISTLLNFGRELEAMAAQQPTSPTADDSDADDSSIWHQLAILIEAATPGTVTPDELLRLIDSVLADSDDNARNSGIAALGLLVQALRTNDPDQLDESIENLRGMVQNATSSDMVWLARTVFPAVLLAASSAHGNRQDKAKAADLLKLDWSSLSPDGVLPPPHEPGMDGLTAARQLLDRNLRFSQAVDNEDEAELERQVRELTEADRTADRTSEWYALIPYQLALAELGLAVRRRDPDLQRQASRHLRAALDAPTPAALRPLLEATWPAMLTVSALLERQPAELTEAITRARRSLTSTPAAHSQHMYTRIGIALALKAQHAMVDEPAKSAALQDAINELEQARDALTERTGPTVTNEVLWQLAEAYWLQSTLSHDSDGPDDRAVALTLHSLRVIADDVLLQLGTEHGLEAARVGAGRGLRAAGWALADGYIDEAVECLERGRALVLQAAATARTVPDRLRAVGAPDLADQWERAVPPRHPATHSADEHANPPLFDLDDDDYINLPSDLRRRALEALRTHEISLSPSSASSSPLPPHTPVAIPTIQHLADHLQHANLDALVYLLPETDAAGRAVIVYPDGTTRDLPLTGLSATGRAPFDRYLDTATHRLARLRNEHAARDRGRDLDPAAPRWEDSLDELCDWAGTAVLDTLIDHLPVDPTPDAPARVVFVPCGSLGLVPWHAAKLSRIPPASDATRPLRACDLLVISYAASAGELLRSLTRDREPYDADPVIVVDPSKTLHYAGREALAIRRTYLPKARLIGFTEGHPVEAPGTPDEVLALLTGRDGNPSASMLQITAHGTASTRPSTSRLLLAAPSTSPDRNADVGPQHLTVADILDASQPAAAADCASLVILDCCETDLSSRDHDEALTLTTAFVARGATDVVGSRWSIDDWSAAVCIVAFHHFLATRGPADLAPADALRAAQRWMLDPAREPIPALTDDLLQHMHQPLDAVSSWAPFIHQGNARPR